MTRTWSATAGKTFSSGGGLCARGKSIPIVRWTHQSSRRGEGAMPGETRLIHHLLVRNASSRRASEGRYRSRLSGSNRTHGRRRCRAVSPKASRRRILGRYRRSEWLWGIRGLTIKRWIETAQESGHGSHRVGIRHSILSRGRSQRGKSSMRRLILILIRRVTDRTLFTVHTGLGSLARWTCRNKGNTWYDPRWRGRSRDITSWIVESIFLKLRTFTAKTIRF